MAKIAQYAMKNPTFREIVATVRLPWNGREWQTELINHNKLLRNYEGATGIKNGFTDQAMHTLVGSAKRGETELIAVTMKAGSSAYAYKDVTAMLDYGFAHYETRQVATAGQTFGQEAAANDAAPAVTYQAETDLYATVPKGTEPQTELTADGQLLVRAGEMTQTLPLLRKDPPRAAAIADAAPKEKEADSAWPRYAIFFAWLMLNLFLFVLTVARSRRRRRERLRHLPRRAHWS
jgi:D-alanyl-D-alanine carboxypeptidase/D-alanyl-D-alanine carboxypeptidase (penicillin-binding protein 5/6)